MESAAARLQKEAKGYLDSLRGLYIIVFRGHESTSISQKYTAMTASQMRIAETIDAFYGDAGANDGVSRSYKQAVEDLDAETIKALDGPFRYAITKSQPQALQQLIPRIIDKQCSNPSLASATTSPISTNVGILSICTHALPNTIYHIIPTLHLFHRLFPILN